MKNLIQSKLEEFRKKDFYFTNENGKRVLHTNRDTTDDVEQFLSQSLEEAINETRKEDINKLNYLLSRTQLYCPISDVDTHSPRKDYKTGKAHGWNSALLLLKENLSKETNE